MPFSDNTKYLIVGAVVLLLIFALYSRNDYPIHNVGNVVMDMVAGEDEGIVDVDDVNYEQQLLSGLGDEVGSPYKGKNGSSDEWLCSKFNSRNKARGGKYKSSSYNKGQRGNLGPSDWDDYFEGSNGVIGGHRSGNGDFYANDETDKTLAIFKQKGETPCGSNQNCCPEDLFDVDKYLPQEVNDDWFEVQPEPVSVKNRHLINITKPVGVNTIATSLKNSSHDIRGAPNNPKTVISPFLNSSIEPDINFKPLF